MQVKTSKLVDELGSYWEYTTSRRVVQKLGQPYSFDSRAVASKGEALTLEVDAVKNYYKTQEEIDTHALNRNRILIWLCRKGILVNKDRRERVLEHVEKLEKDIEKAQRVLEDLTSADIEVEELPETVNVPNYLHIGDKVYLVCASWINQPDRPMEIREHTVTEVTVNDLRGQTYPETQYDFDFSYRARKDVTDKRPISFSMKTESKLSEVPCNVSGQRLFTSKKAAEQGAREMAEQVLANIRKFL